MGIAPTLRGAWVIEANGPLRLRYALYVHAGLSNATAIEKQYTAFASSEAPPERVLKK